MPTNKGLGRGFDALVPNTIVIQDVVNRSEDKVHHLAIDAVKPRNNQPRRRFDEQELDQLTVSVKKHGILQPIIVVRGEQESYSIVAGERRWRAAKAAGLKELPAIVKTFEELQLLELSLLENVQRSDLSPLEVAFAIDVLHRQFGQSFEDIAASLGKAYVTIINNQRLLKLPDHIKIALQEKQITEGHARSILSLQSKPELQEKLYQEILKRHLNVRQAEVMANNLKNQKTKPRSNKEDRAKQLAPIAQKLSNQLGMKVSIKIAKKGGSLSVRYKNMDELQAILEKLESKN